MEINLYTWHTKTTSVSYQLTGGVGRDFYTLKSRIAFPAFISYIKWTCSVIHSKWQRGLGFLRGEKDQICKWLNICSQQTKQNCKIEDGVRFFAIYTVRDGKI